jgi:methyl-galactoside transport system substrate-binding protein
MKLSRKIIFFIKVVLIVCTLSNTTKISVSANQNINYDYRKPANIAVLFNLNTSFMKEFRKSFENFENENKNKVKFTYYDENNNPSVQNQIIDTVTNSKYDLIVSLLADTTEDTVKDFTLKAKQHNIPLILMNISPEIAEKVSQYYDKVAFLLMSPQSAGTAEGQIIADMWNNDKSLIDKNGDGILQYILIKGKSNEIIVEDRANSAISAINNSGIKTEELQTVYSDWTREVSQNAIENIFLRYGNRIEAIIAVTDEMAIGAIEALQEYGYNTGDKSKYIPVVGIAGIPDAKELIDKGLMAGTVIQDTDELVKGIYTIGINLIDNKNPLENTNYKLENNEIMILENPAKYISKPVLMHLM